MMRFSPKVYFQPFTFIFIFSAPSSGIRVISTIKSASNNQQRITNRSVTFLLVLLFQEAAGSCGVGGSSRYQSVKKEAFTAKFVSLLHFGGFWSLNWKKALLTMKGDSIQLFDSKRGKGHV